MRSLVHAWKSTLVLNLLCVVVCATLLAFVQGFRLPLGSFGVTLLNDPVGRPFVVVDHVSTRGWLLAYDSRQQRAETWEGTILPH